MSAMQSPLYQTFEPNNAPAPASAVPRPRGELPAAQVTRPRTLNDYRIGVRSTPSRPSSRFGHAMIIGVAAVVAGAFVMLDPLHVMSGAKGVPHQTPSSTTSVLATPPAGDATAISPVSPPASPGDAGDSASARSTDVASSAPLTSKLSASAAPSPEMLSRNLPPAASAARAPVASTTATSRRTTSRDQAVTSAAMSTTTASDVTPAIAAPAAELRTVPADTKSAPAEAPKMVTEPSPAKDDGV